MPSQVRNNNFVDSPRKLLRKLEKHLRKRLTWAVFAVMFLVGVGFNSEQIEKYFRYETIPAIIADTDPLRQSPMIIFCMAMLDHDHQLIDDSNLTSPTEFQTRSANFDDMFYYLRFSDKASFFSRGKKAYKEFVSKAVRKTRFLSRTCFFLDCHAVFKNYFLTQSMLQESSSIGEFISLRLNLTNINRVNLLVRPRKDYSLEFPDLFSSEPIFNSSRVIVKIEQSVFRNLPAPYNTRCHDYSSEADITSMGNCRRRCVLAEQIQKNNMIVSDWPFFNTSLKNYTTRFAFLSSRCSTRCRQSCRTTTFSTKFLNSRRQTSISQQYEIFLPQIVSHITMTPKMTFRDLTFIIFSNFAYTIGSSFFTIVLPIVLYLLHVHIERQVRLLNDS